MLFVQIYLADDEHVDGTAWQTTRRVSTLSGARNAALNWLRQVRAAGAPVWHAAYRIDSAAPWINVYA